MRFAGRVALVTGAGSGIGRACVLRLAAEGASVAVADVRGAAAAELVVKDGGSALPITADVSAEEDVRSMVAAAVEEYGRLDVLHNNAAVLSREVYGRDLDLTEMDIEVWDRTRVELPRLRHERLAHLCGGSPSSSPRNVHSRVNLRGAMLGIKHAVPRMRAGGAIVTTTSVSALLGDTDHAAYGSAKAALIDSGATAHRPEHALRSMRT